jgi:hypothetical protein
LIDYAYTGDFTFNLLNAGLIPGLREMGLLELHLGDDGPLMKFGSDGVDVSMLGTQILNAGIRSLVNLISGINRQEEINIDRPLYPEEELEPEPDPAPDIEERVAALFERSEAEESVHETPPEPDIEEKVAALLERNEAEESVHETPELKEPELKEPELTESELAKKEAERIENEQNRIKREAEEVAGEKQLKKARELYKDASAELGKNNQKTLGAVTGLRQNNTCLVYTIYLLYQLTAPASISRLRILEGVRDAIKNGSINSTNTDNNARVDKFKEFIETMNTAIYGKKDKEKWNYDKIMTSATEFFNSDYEYGIMVYEKFGEWSIPEKKRSTHFLLVDNKNKKIYDPWPGGIGSTWKVDYFLSGIRPLKK